MLTEVRSITRPDAGTSSPIAERARPVAVALGLVGVTLAGVTLVVNLAAAADSASDPQGTAETLAWSFGLTTTAFATIKLAISGALVAILGALWQRVAAVQEALPALKPPADAPGPAGDVATTWGPAAETATVPAPLPVHRMARTMWAPMLAMGYAAVLVGLVLSFVWSSRVADGTATAVAAWTQGTQFLGEALVLAGISFLLGAILAALRDGGGQVQQALGLPVRTLQMPKTAKAFVALMMAGLMVGVAQFVLYGFAATADGAQSFAAWGAWLGPLREFSLGLLLAGIVLALVTIGNVLAFQFDRIRGIVATGS